jgi:hypothetical protein
MGALFDPKALCGSTSVTPSTGTAAGCRAALELSAAFSVVPAEAVSMVGLPAGGKGVVVVSLAAEAGSASGERDVEL